MFDKTEAYRKYVKPYLEQAYRASELYGIPCFFSCCVRDDGKNTCYENIINGAVSNGLHLADDQFTRHINVANGFDTILNDSRLDVSTFDIPEIGEESVLFEKDADG